MANTFNHNGKVVITSGGNVGIGTTSPTYKLHVSSSNNNDGIAIHYPANNSTQFPFYVGDSSNDVYARLNATEFEFKRNGAASTIKTVGSSNNLTLESATNLIFNTNGTSERMRIDTSGNVGIGTTSPSTPLEIVHSSGNAFIVRTNDSTAANNAGFILANVASATQSSRRSVFVMDANGANGSGVDYTYFDVYGNGVTSIVNAKSDGILAFGTADTERMRITSAGNVGIGTTNPSAKLEIETNDLVTRAIFVKGIDSEIYAPTNNGGYGVFSITSDVGSTRSSKFFVNAAGNVGIGTTSPSYKLQISDTVANGRAVQAVQTATSGTNYGAVLAAEGSGATKNIGLYANAIGATTNYAAIFANGNVGIGTTEPDFKLDINGEVRLGNGLLFSGTNSYPRLARSTNDLTFQTNAAGEVMRITNAGSVGIGTSSPSTALAVNGGTSGNAVVHMQHTNADGYSGIDFFENTGTLVGSLWHANSGGVATNQNAMTLAARNSGDKVYIVAGGYDPTTSGGITVAAGNVGIGTTSPNRTLTVNGIFGVTNGTANTQQLVISTDANGAYLTSSYIGSSPYVPMIFETGGSERMRITTDGSLLVGATNPDIGGSVKGTIIRQDGSIVAARNIASPFHYQTPISADRMNTMGDGIMYSMWREGIFQAGIGATNASNMTFFTGDNSSASERMRINSAGNVGIGTTNPDNGVLTILKNTSYATESSYGISIQSFSSNAYTELQIGADDTVDCGVIQTAGKNTSWTSKKLALQPNGGNILIGTTTNSGDRLFVNGSVKVDSGNGLSVVGFNSNTGLRLNYGNASGQISVINLIANGVTNGYIGIQMVDSSTGDMWLGGSGGRTMTIYRDGNVGIGTTAPTSKLHVASGRIEIDNGQSLSSRTSGGGNLFPLIQMSSNEITVGGWEGSYMSNLNLRGGNGAVLADFSQGNASFFAVRGVSGITPSEYMRVTSAGNVGIGTTAPSAKLEVYAGSNSTANTILWGQTIRNAGNAATTGYGAGLKLKNSDETAPNEPYKWAGIASVAGANYSDRTDLAFYTNAGVIAEATEKVRITGDGNLGIGTIAPGVPLSVAGVGGSTKGTNGYLVNIGGTDSNVDPVRYMIGFSHGNTYTAANVRAAVGMMVTTGGAGNLVFETGSSGAGQLERMRINGSGDVGIGTTAPTEKLHVDGSVVVTYNNSYQGINSVGNKAILARVSPTTGIINYAEYATAANLNGFVMGSDDARVKGNIATDSLEFITNGSTQVTVLSNGDVGIGTTSPTEKLQVNGSLKLGDGNADGPQLKLASSGYSDWNIDNFSGSLRAYYGSTEYTRLTSSGNFGIGVTPSYKLDVAGDTRITSGSLGVGVLPDATDGRIDASNDIVAYSSSDRRLKENITPIANALDKVKSLTGVEFDWKPEHKKAHGYEGHDTGVIAQEVQEVMPTAVRTNNTGYLAVRYEKLIGLLIEANKELAARVEELEKKLK